MSSDAGTTENETGALTIVPSLEMYAVCDVASGSTAETTSGSLATAAIDVLTASACSETVPVFAWKTIEPE